MSDSMTLDDVKEFAKDRNKYPVHYYMHTCHCCEIIGYKHPNQDIREWFYNAYLIMVKSLYLNPETETECDDRLMDGETKPFEKMIK
jgi:hypothetical protein